VAQEVQQDELCLVNVRVLGPSSPAPGGMQLFKPPAPDAAAEARATGRTQRGTAAAPPPAATLPIVRSVDVSLAAHIEGLAPQVCQGTLGCLLTSRHAVHVQALLNYVPALSCAAIITIVSLPCRQRLLLEKWTRTYKRPPFTGCRRTNTGARSVLFYFCGH
jgi:hypothetical protein